MARVVLDETETFMENLECLTADLQHACLSLQRIFDKAIASEAGLECRVHSNKVFPAVWERRFTRMCWDLLRETHHLIYVISRKGGKAKRMRPKLRLVMQYGNGARCAGASANHGSADISHSS
jgi:hypothetical protein